jgi:hypothetical protein
MEISKAFLLLLPVDDGSLFSHFFALRLASSTKIDYGKQKFHGGASFAGNKHVL